MVKYRKLVVLMGFLFVIGLLPTMVLAQLPDGVSLKVLGAFPSDIPGIKEVQLQEFSMEPGSKIENLTVGNTALCTGTKGILTVVSSGKTVIYGVGSQWTVPKGTIASLYNNSDELHVHRIWRLVREG